ncbi:MAG: aminotransferase class I/II-fold pyridoxal phosphate-dependent enzyme [Clostridiales bacterium]|nr:aminotransferase class I/II-fold pyridoxal phosphate-dependent enzyme [Clostridiales bacterium]
MDHVISLGIGEPDFPTPWHIRNTAIQTLEKSRTKYTANAGIAELREEISSYLHRRFQLTYRPETQILVTVGGSEAIDLAMRTFIEPGDEVIVPFPSFVCYGPLAALCGAKVVPIHMRSEDQFKLTPELLKNAITEKTKLLVLPFPNNPTGAIMEREDLEAIATVLRDTKILVISDEIYGELNYTGTRHVSIAELPGMKERTILINGFSKTYSMTGWRLGYACAEPEIIAQMTKLHQYAIMCAPTTSQFAAIEALRNGDDDVSAMRQEYNYRRRFIVNGFNKLGLTCFEPLGAFYCFPSIKRTGMSSEHFCDELLRREKVAIVPGSAFGSSGEGFVRVSYAYSIEHIKKALEAIGHFLDSAI